MKRPLKSNQRRKLLNRQHHKVTTRRQSHFNQTINELVEAQATSQINR
ncbi:hypothetical protein [Colwellia psychrerythraea]|uniref:Uncharacterized protein n=1 Tax=Colwellia psychrerythraea TaxID=28229 RepID=A0A099KZT9_COLPS|nr:hypothetical protein [Colwellia psychrerythraea]KGJ96269.1 hypothetical protein GAB14E_0216 [Colwellia psychrerythraea]